jgi:general secretion pathway protein G
MRFILLSVAIATASILAAVSVAYHIWNTVSMQTTWSAAPARLRVVAMALEMYRRDTGYLPTRETGLSALLRSEPRGPYVIGKDELLDPWKRPILYEPNEAGGFTVKSLGADGKPGGSGIDVDISFSVGAPVQSGSQVQPEEVQNTNGPADE